jgi:hypothetical protein
MPNARMTLNNGFEGRWKEVVVAYYRALGQRIPGGTEVYHENPPSE